MLPAEWNRWPLHKFSTAQPELFDRSTLAPPHTDPILGTCRRRVYAALGLASMTAAPLRRLSLDSATALPFHPRPLASVLAPNAVGRKQHKKTKTGLDDITPPPPRTCPRASSPSKTQSITCIDVKHRCMRGERGWMRDCNTPA